MPRRNSKKKVYTQTIIIVTAVVAATISSLLLFNRFDNRPGFTDEFGIALPLNFSIHGIDVSRYQSSIKWDRVAEAKADQIKINFVFIKATEGVSSIDPMFKRNWKGAANSGITRGAYHFFYPSLSGKAQAEHFISMVDLESGDLRPVLDVEKLYGASATVMRQRVADWLNAVESKYKVKPIIYTNVNFYTNYLLGRFDDYPLWVAHYFEPYNPKITRNWNFWQHSEKGKVKGIRGHVDFNVFNGDSAEFNEMRMP